MSISSPLALSSNTLDAVASPALVKFGLDEEAEAGNRAYGGGGGREEIANLSLSHALE